MNEQEPNGRHAGKIVVSRATNTARQRVVP